MAQKTTTKSRGVFLTVMIVFAAYGVLSSLYTLTNPSALTTAYGVLPIWFYPYLIVSFIAGAAELIGLWLWKKWAVYLLFGLGFLGLAMQLTILKPVSSNAGSLVFYLTIISLGIWFWAIYRKWQYFD